MRRAHEAIEAMRLARAARESELAGARIEHDARAAGIPRARARARRARGAAEVARGARRRRVPNTATPPGCVLAEANGNVSTSRARSPTTSRSTAATSARSKRASAICCSTSSSQRSEQAAAGLAFARAHDAGRVGFLVAGSAPAASSGRRLRRCPRSSTRPCRCRRASAVPPSDAIRAAMRQAWIARQTIDSARSAAAASTARPIATLDGEVFRGAHVVEGGTRAEARGILTTKREIKELRERADSGTPRRGAAARRDRVARRRPSPPPESAIAAVQGEQHRQEKAIVGFELQVASAREAVERIRRKHEQIATERRTAEEELRAQEARQEEARESIARIEARAAHRRRSAELRAAPAVRGARSDAGPGPAHLRSEGVARRARRARQRPGHRSQRLEEAAARARKRVSRPVGRSRSATHAPRSSLVATIERVAKAARCRTARVRRLRDRVRTADETSQSLRAAIRRQEARIREARRCARARAQRGRAARRRPRDGRIRSRRTWPRHCVEAVQARSTKLPPKWQQLESRRAARRARVPIDDAPDRGGGGRTTRRRRPPRPSTSRAPRRHQTS